MVSLIVLLGVFIGVALRQTLRIPLRIWQMMGIGASIVLFTGQISLFNAWDAINWDIIFFLAGMFVIGQALEESGILQEVMQNRLEARQPAQNPEADLAR